MLGYVLDGWLTDLSYHLEFDQPYTSIEDRYSKLKQTIACINWLQDKMADEMPDGQDMIDERERPLFNLIRDAGLDLSFRVMGIERKNEEAERYEQ